MSGGSEERIDGGSVSVFFGALAQAGMAVVDMEVPIGRGYVDSSRLDRLAVTNVSGRQRTRATENSR